VAPRRVSRRSQILHVAVNVKKVLTDGQWTDGEGTHELIPCIAEILTQYQPINTLLIVNFIYNFTGSTSSSSQYRTIYIVNIQTVSRYEMFIRNNITTNNGNNSDLS